MKISIVCYEDPSGWILGKFATRLHDELARAGEQVRLVRAPDPDADVNHHIIYLDYRPSGCAIDTVMVTHVDSVGKARLLRDQLGSVRGAVCMSRQTVAELTAAGCPRQRLCTILPAHDGDIGPRRAVLGITSKVHADGRKREGMLLELAARIPASRFSFSIMGSGWDDIVGRLRADGFTVEYRPAFDRGAYVQMMPGLDAYLYFGEDEGSMGFIDAMAAGVPVFVTPQGYHLDAAWPIDAPVTSVDSLVAACLRLVEERHRRAAGVADWTWSSYARRHVELWRNLAAGRDASLLDGPSGDPGISRARLWRRLFLGSLRDRLGAFRSTLQRRGQG